MNKSLGLCLVSLAACATLVGAAKWREATATPDLAPLDKAMQVRFEVPEGFGMGREFRIPEHTKTPILSSSAAREAVAVLRAQGWDVNFYLGGRELLDPNRKNRSLARQQSSLGLINQPFRDLRGPVALMPPAQQNAPDRDAISAQAKLALEADQAQDYHSRVGQWQLAAYPVTATKQACVRCHDTPENRRQLGRAPKIGDTLGVTVYAYRRAK